MRLNRHTPRQCPHAVRLRHTLRQCPHLPCTCSETQTHTQATSTPPQHKQWDSDTHTGSAHTSPAHAVGLSGCHADNEAQFDMKTHGTCVAYTRLLWQGRTETGLSKPRNQELDAQEKVQNQKLEFEFYRPKPGIIWLQQILMVKNQKRNKGAYQRRSRLTRLQWRVSHTRQGAWQQHQNFHTSIKDNRSQPTKQNFRRTICFAAQTTVLSKVTFETTPCAIIQKHYWYAHKPQIWKSGWISLWLNSQILVKKIVSVFTWGKPHGRTFHSKTRVAPANFVPLSKSWICTSHNQSCTGRINNIHPKCAMRGAGCEYVNRYSILWHSCNHRRGRGEWRGG